MATIYAPLTPIMPSPVIALRVSGPDTIKVLSMFKYKHFDYRKSLNANYRSISHPEISDDVLFTVYKSPHSYTGEDVLEIFFHGNPLIVRAAMEDINNMGIRMAESGEFSKRAVINGKLTLSEAEGVNALIHSKTIAGVSLAYNNLKGALEIKIQKLRDSILYLLTEVEVYIDFFEDEPDLDKIKHSLGQLINDLEQLVKSYESNKYAVHGINIGIVGRPNAGKSSIFNALLNEERAIVSTEEGTTRDTLSENIVDNGLNYTVTDTAGIRETGSDAENKGIERTFNVINNSDIVLILTDLSVDNDAIYEKILSEISGKACITVGTKADLRQKSKYITDIKISVNERKSIGSLQKIIATKASKLLTQAMPEGLTGERQYMECRAALEAVTSINFDETLDIIAYKLRQAAENIDTLSGANISEDMLDKVFAGFCIGK